MKTEKLFRVVVPILAVLAAAAAVAVFWPRSEEFPDRPFAPAEIAVVNPGANCRLELAGDRIAAGPRQFPSSKGFVERVALANSVLDVRGWAPMDVRSPDGRIIIRDPFGMLNAVGETTITPRERPDVQKGHPDEPALLHSGFFLEIPLADSVDDRKWLNSLEFYALDGDGKLFRLSRINQVLHSGWARQPDAFELSLVYSNPPYAKTTERSGHIDGIVVVGDGTVELQGWAPMNLRSPETRLSLRLSPRLAPVSILEVRAVERPDVAARHGSASRDLRYSGFRIVLETRWRTDGFHRKDAVKAWAIGPDTDPVALYAPAR